MCIFEYMLKAKLHNKFGFRVLFIFTLFYLNATKFAFSQKITFTLIKAEINYVINKNTAKDLHLQFSMNEKGYAQGSFKVYQTFEFNPGYETIRFKGNLCNSNLCDSVFVYNDKGQVLESGFFNHQLSYGKLDTIAGYGKLGFAGIREGLFIFYSSGKDFKSYRKESEINFKYGFREGKYTLFYPDGLPQLIKNYEKDILQGEYLKYYSDGTLQEKKYYFNGKLEGERLIFHPNGKLAVKDIFQNGSKTKNPIYFDENGNEKIVEDDGMIEPVEIDKVNENYYRLIPAAVPFNKLDWANFPSKRKLQQLKGLKKSEIRIDVKNRTISGVKIQNATKSKRKTKKLEDYLLHNLRFSGIYFNRNYFDGEIYFSISDEASN